MIDTASYKTKLETELKILTEELRSLGIQNPDTPSDWVPTPDAITQGEADENVVADRSEEWQVNRGTLDALETRYNNLTRALKKIMDGTYGICEISGEPIEADRLDANPAARTCKAHLEDESQLSQ